MEEVKIYEVFGQIGHEKERVFCDTNRIKTDMMEEIIITLPDGWKTEKTMSGMVLLCSPWNKKYMVSDILKDEGDSIWIDTIDSTGLKYRRKIK